ncbi:flagellar motor stator protein MotA [Sphingomonas sp. AAP5]|jgi:chemotaxis protein MotA|uniref:Flagellar motor stator protein MotA n=2 Tax=Sphingomonas glacialis TaxID=658225 RepID=A0A502FFV3_9SPHN|nr:MULTISPECIES: flagellar motor stator protein MotA [Sphingomonas]MDY7523597.1 flagellar motor stator protein MotA [Sphingomonas sp. 10B4]MEB0282858.1 flagellar motor stator protein MotA [Sphingomonas sp. 10B4]QBM77341.1 flagellar motor stator protein MotA [Sphingomonas sp. AAP5]TPG48254.1 flagellar motor stator protein MotA [Sphingomonas glacialis]
MFPVIGIVVLLVMIFGGFAITGGALGPVMEAIPHEMLIIGGAAVGALIIGNSMKELKALGGGLMKVFKGPKYKKQDYLDVIFLVSKLMKMLRTEGPIALEPHVEDPASSAVFAEYPRLLSDHALTNLIADTLRLVVVSSGTLDVHAVEDVMDNMIKTHHHEVEGPQGTIATLADALPALGIVAAVLGVVKTMGSIDKPPAILGAMIGSALVGTFMGVLLAYGIVAPLANRLKQVLDADGAIYHVVKQIIIASLHGHPQPLVIEAARSGIAHSNQPGFAEVFDGLRGR